jgi:hypothetical protein
MKIIITEEQLSYIEETLRRGRFDADYEDEYQEREYAIHAWIMAWMADSRTLNDVRLTPCAPLKW